MRSLQPALALAFVFLSPHFAFAQQNCTTIESATDRLDCYDAFFKNAEAEPVDFPDPEEMITHLVGQTFFETDKSPGGARGWNVGRRSDITQLLVTRQSVFEDRLEVEVEVKLGPSNGQFWIANLEMLYVLNKGQWLLGNAGMRGNFRYTPASG